MSVSHKKISSNILFILKKMHRLQSTLSVLVAVVLYTCLASWWFLPTVATVNEKEGSLLLLSTDCNEPLRSSMVASIDKAQSSVLLFAYTLSDKKILFSLKNAAYRGVDVSVIYDPVASPEAPFLLGNKVRAFPRRKSGLMHLKILVVDKAITWLGSANMTSTSLIQHGNIMASIRSTQLAETLHKYSQTVFTGGFFRESPLCIQFPEQKLTYFLLPRHSAEALSTLVSKIENAQRRVFVAMYTFTHPDLLRAVLNAKKRGVDVRVLFDRDSSRQTSKRAYISCKRAGIFCGFRKKSGLLHYKTALIDNCLVLGSANWTKAAFRTNDDSLLLVEPLTMDLEKWASNWWHALELEL